MDISSFAPVVIPTLCRDVHFIRCVESLKKNKYANKTHLIIAVDYPSKPEHWEGYRRICSYLDTISGFEKVTVIKREENWGAVRNGNAVRDLGFSLSDSVIFTEDDNEFSPNFLEYINKALIRFKDDDRIIWVTGYTKPYVFPSSYKNNFYIERWGSAWGCGFWRHKFEQYKDLYDIDYLKKLLLTRSIRRELREKDAHYIYSILSMIKTGDVCGDTLIGCYSTLHDKYAIRPVLSKVRNHGQDGSGVHSAIVNPEVIRIQEEHIIDESQSFEFSDDIFTMKPTGLVEPFPKVRHPFRNFVKMCLRNFDLMCFLVFHRVPKSKYL